LTANALGERPPLARRCACQEPQYALCTPGALDDESLELLKANFGWVGKYVCYYCGAVSDGEPYHYESITGGSVIKRLLELGIIQAPDEKLKI
jgi:hypothetical protein